MRKEQWKERIDIYAFGGAMIFGFLAFAYQLFNKISSNDDLGMLYGSGAGIYNGRWLTGWFSNLNLVNAPFSNGIITIIILAVSSMLLIHLLKIKSKTIAFLIGGAFVTFPSNISLLLYMFTAPAYSMGVFLAVLAAFCVAYENKHAWLVHQIGALCIICSLAFYQAYLAVTISACCLSWISYTKESDSIKSVILKIFQYFAIIIEGLVLYIVMQKQLMTATGLSTTYQNINALGTIDIDKIITAIPIAYVSFFEFFDNIRSPVKLQDLFGFVTSIASLICLTMYAVGCFVKKRNIIQAVLIVLCATIFPLACNLTYFYGSEGVHTLMLYGNVFPLITILQFVDTLKMDFFERYSKKVVAYAATLVIIMNCLLANNVFYIQQFTFNATVAYCDRIVTQIMSLEDYSPEYPIAFAGRTSEPTVLEYGNYYQKSDLVGTSTMDILLNTVLYWDWCQADFFHKYCGFVAQFHGFQTNEERKEFSQKDEVKAMAVYPRPGSIKVVDNMIVVKMSE